MHNGLSDYSISTWDRFPKLLIKLVLGHFLFFFNLKCLLFIRLRVYCYHIAPCLMFTVTPSHDNLTTIDVFPLHFWLCFCFARSYRFIICFLSVGRSIGHAPLEAFCVESSEKNGERPGIELKKKKKKDLYIYVYCKTIVMRISDHFRERQKNNVTYYYEEN